MEVTDIPNLYIYTIQLTNVKITESVTTVLIKCVALILESIR